MEKLLLRDIIPLIPSKYQKILSDIMRLTFNNGKISGINQAFELMKQVTELPPDKLTDYGVYHNDEIDGG